MLEAMLDPEVLTSDRIRPLSRREYETIVDAGVFWKEPVELLRGVVVKMSPHGVPHAEITARLAQWFSKILDYERYDVRCQLPYAATDDSMPEPDVYVTSRTHSSGHPSTALLVIEVADSSLRMDRVIKSEIYAENGVPEYWIINVNDRVVEVLTEPAADGYRKKVTFASGDVLRPAQLPGIAIAIADLPWSSD